MYPSPFRDDGYDIADYGSIHPQYGTLDDFRRFLAGAHERGMRVITELVLNHTSDLHPWFIEARSSLPPAGPQLRQPRLARGDVEVMRFWLDQGVDGLRVDAVPYLIEREGTSCENLPETHEVLKYFRRRIEESYPGRMLLAEANMWPEDVRERWSNEPIRPSTPVLADVAAGPPAAFARCSIPRRPEGRPSPPTCWCGSPCRCARTSAGGRCSWSPRGRTDGGSRSSGRFAYAADPPFTELADLTSEAARAGESPDYAALGRAVDAVAGLTAVDGATLINDCYELLAFGVKIGQPDGRLRVERVVVTELVEGAGAGPLQLGGTRSSRPRSSRRTGRVPSRWWPRRTAASRPSRGRRARRWCTPTAWRRCCSRTGSGGGASAPAACRPRQAT